MFKLLVYINILLMFENICEGKTLKRGRLSDVDDLWFPHPPGYQGDVNPTSSEERSSDNSNASEWPELWFPHPPNYQIKPYDKEVFNSNNTTKNQECDDGKYNLSVDYDPQDKRHAFNHLCIGNKSDYVSNINTSALLTEYFIPAAYEAHAICLNTSIQYLESIPTFGAYRPLAPKFGTYQFLPPQRWMRSLADGAIVGLYHPCASASQKEKLQKTLRGCLYRHILTPSLLLTPNYPLALLVWGKSLQMSVVDDAIIVQFIKDNAKKGFRDKQQKLKIFSKLYDADLLTEAHLITDEQDKEICGYKNMR